MKKVYKYLFIFVLVSLFSIVGVRADSGGSPYWISVDDIAEDSYVIGTHLFNRSTNSDYKGYLNTKAVMLAAQTINGDTLDKMIIYYKTIDGDWIDALTSEEVNPPLAPTTNCVEIKYINTRSNLSTPSVDLGWPGAGDHSWGDTPEEYLGHGKDYWLRTSNDWDEKNVKLEIYYSNTIDGEYTAVNVSESAAGPYDGENFIYELVNVPKGTTFFYKVRFVKEYGDEKVYSDFSYPVECNNTDIEITIAPEKFYTVDNEKVFRLIVDSIGRADGVDLIKGDEQLVASYTIQEVFDNHGIIVPVDENSSGETYSVVGYEWVNEEKRYILYSNPVLLDYDFDLEVESHIYESSNEYAGVYISSGNYAGNNYTDGIKVYCQDGGEEYVLVATSEVGEHYTNISIPKGESTYCKVSLYKDDKESNKSKAIRLSANLEKPVLSYIATYGNDSIGTNYINVNFEIQYDGLGDNFEIYTSDSELGTYILDKEIYGKTFDDVVFGGKYYKVKAFTEGQDGRIYSQLSDSVSVFFGGEWDYNFKGFAITENGIMRAFKIGREKLDGYSGFDYEISHEEGSGIGGTSYDANAIIYLNNDYNYEVTIKPFQKNANGTVYGTTTSFIINKWDELNTTIDLEAFYSKSNANSKIYKLFIKDEFISYPFNEYGYELYHFDTDTGEYKLYKTFNSSDEGFQKNKDYGFPIEIANDTNEFFKVRFVNYGLEGEVVSYSDFSEIEKIVNKVDDIDYKFAFIESTNSTKTTIGISTFRYCDGGGCGDVYIPHNFDGTEIFASNDINGEYTKVTSGGKSDYIKITINNSKVKKYYKVRTYIMVDGEKIYSEFSNPIELENVAFYVSYSFMGATANDNYSSYAINVEPYFANPGAEYKLYVSDTSDGEYTLVDKTIIKNQNGGCDYFFVDIDDDDVKYFKVKLTNTVNGVDYVSWSKVLEVKGATTVVEPE